MGTMVVTSEIMDVILASTDALRQMIDNLESTNAEGDVEIEHIMAQIDAIMAGETAPQLAVQPEAAAEVADVADAPTAEEAADEATLTPRLPSPQMLKQTHRQMNTPRLAAMPPIPMVTIRMRAALPCLAKTGCSPCPKFLRIPSPLFWRGPSERFY